MDSRVAQALAVPTRAELLRLLRAAERPRTAADLAAATGLHVNTVRSHLELLVDVALAVRGVEAPHGPGRPQVGYLAAAVAGDRPEPAATGPGTKPATDYRELAAALADELTATGDAGRIAVDAGRRWADTIDRSDWPQRTADR
jgi:predicted ArsR family transcriptional regulator